MDDDLEVFDELEDLSIDLDGSITFNNLTISQLISLISKLITDNGEDVELVEDWLVIDFQIYDESSQYDSKRWKHIADYAQGLLMKRCLNNLKLKVK